MIDRLSICKPPAGPPVMYQTWDKLLFMHWRIQEKLLRSLVPPPLSIDKYDGSAWIGLIPFTMRGIRPKLFPALPLVSKSHELNVRTYVYLDGVPGVWFLSLDANNPLAVGGARLGFSLPYFRAKMSLTEQDATIRFTSLRRQAGAPPAKFEAVWTQRDGLAQAGPDSLEFFLTERYCLYTQRRDRIYRTRICHSPWSLRSARLLSFSSIMLESHGLPSPGGHPLLHSQAESLKVSVWPLKQV